VLNERSGARLSKQMKLARDDHRRFGKYASLCSLR